MRTLALGSPRTITPDVSTVTIGAEVRGRRQCGERECADHSEAKNECAHVRFLLVFSLLWTWFGQALPIARQTDAQSAMSTRLAGAASPTEGSLWMRVGFSLAVWPQSHKGVKFMLQCGMGLRIPPNPGIHRSTSPKPTPQPVRARPVAKRRQHEQGDKRQRCLGWIALATRDAILC